MFRLLGRLGFGGIIAVAFLMLLMLFSNTWTYMRLTQETPVGEVHFEALGEKRYAVKFIEANKQSLHTFELSGDQWRLDARVLKWKAWAVLLGKDPWYQLDRISGRFVDFEMASRTLPSMYAFFEPNWLDPWHLAHAYPETFFMVDAGYGSSVYLPMADGARYQVSMSTTGLLARRLD